MRSEYLGDCTLIEGLPEVINRGLYLTPRMSRDECRQAIVGPAEVFDFAIEDALVNKLLNDLTDFAPWDARRDHDQRRRLRPPRRPAAADAACAQSSVAAAPRSATKPTSS